MQQQLEANRVNLCAETFGDPAHPPLLLISGASGSMDWWRTEFCRRLAEGGRQVIRYDHRDTGQSAHSTPGAPDYTGSDLVADAVGVLDALGIQRAHIAGASMGGGIGQVIALDHPERVASLTLMSTSPGGGDDLPGPTGAVAASFASPAPTPDWSNRDQVIDYIVESHRAFSGTLPFDDDEVRALAAVVVDRTIDIEASMTNHWLVGGGDPVRPRIGQIAAPTLVIHGTDDALFPLPHGEALAREIPARLLVIDGMGHEVPPPPVWDEVIDAMLLHTSS